MFLLEVGEPFIAFINFFESRMVRAHVLFPKMALLLNQLFTMFLKPEGRDKLTPRRLIKLDYKDKKTQLSREHIFLGEKTRSFIKKIGMTADSPELQEFFGGVAAFYHETSEKLVKYFKTPLNSRLDLIKLLRILFRVKGVCISNKLILYFHQIFNPTGSWLP